MKINKRTLLALIIILATVLSSSAHGKKKEPWIPEDFNPKNTVLLVQEFVWHRAGVGEKETNKMKAEMDKVYPNKYEIASESEIRKPGKYDDKEKYRYALMWNQGSQATSHGSAGQPTGGASTSNPIFHMYIYDRKLGKAYPENPRFNSFIIRVFNPAVEEIIDFLNGVKK